MQEFFNYICVGQLCVATYSDFEVISTKDQEVSAWIPNVSLFGFYVMEPQKESSKSTFTEFIYACHFLWGKFILQAAGKTKRLKTGFYCLVLTLEVAVTELQLVQPCGCFKREDNYLKAKAV